MDKKRMRVHTFVNNTINTTLPLPNESYRYTISISENATRTCSVSFSLFFFVHYEAKTFLIPTTWFKKRPFAKTPEFANGIAEFKNSPQKFKFT